MFNAEQLQEKWAPLLNSDSADPIKDAHRRLLPQLNMRTKKNF